MRRLARHLLRDAALADDVMQEAWLAVLRRPAAAPRDPRGWFAGVVRNLARRALRRERRQAHHARRAGRPEGTPPTDDVVGRLELQAHLLEAIRRLDEPYRAAITRRYLDGVPPREIAEAAGLPVATVRSHLRRGLERLREALDARPGGRRAWATVLVPWAARVPADLPTVAGTVAVYALAGVAAAAAALLTAGIIARPAPSSAPLPAPRAEEGVTSADVEAGPRMPSLASAPARRASDSRAPTSAEGPAWVEGVVVGAGDRPLAGVPVVATRPAADATGAYRGPLAARFTAGEGATVARATSGPDGRFRLDGLAAGGQYTIAAQPAPPDVGGAVGVAVGVGVEARWARPLRLTVAAGRSVRGLVLDGAGRGREARYVFCDATRRADGAPSYVVAGTTAPDGSFEVSVLDAPLYAQLATADRSVRWELPRPWDGERRFLLDAEAAASVEGTVRTVEGAFVPGAEVLIELRGDGRLLEQWDVRAIADASGRWRADGLPVSRVVAATASAPGFVPVQGTLSGVRGARGEVARLDLRVRSARTLSGRVVAEDGAPVALAWVSIDGYIDDDGWSRLLRADADGLFRWDGQPPGQVALVAWGERHVPRPRPRGTPTRAGASGDGCAPTYVSLAEGDVDVVVSVVAGRFVEGRVVDAGGAPVAGALVRASSRREAPEVLGPVTCARMVGAARTGPDGAFRVGPLSPTGDVRVVAEAGSLRSGPVGEVDVREASVSGLVLRVSEGRHLRGAVREPDGRAVHAAVRVVADDGLVVDEAATDDAGRYELRVDGAGTAEVRVVGRRSVPGTAWPRVDLAAAELPQALEIAIEPRPSISGRVVDARGAPVPRAAIMYGPVGEAVGDDARFRDASDVSGRFEVAVPPGRYRFRTEGDGPSTEADAGATDVVVVLGGQPPRRIVGLLLAPDGRPVGGATLTTFEVGDGACLSHDVKLEGPGLDLTMPASPDASVWVTGARATDGTPLDVQRLRLEPDERAGAPVVHRLVRATAIAGRVVDASGAPAAGRLTAMRRVTDAASRRDPPGLPPTAAIDADGRFRLSGLGAGSYDLYVEPRAPWLAPDGPLACDADQQDVVVVVRRGVAVSGRVVGPLGEPVAGWTVATEGSPPFRRVRTDASGAFTLDGVRPTDGRVRCSAAPDPSGPADSTGFLRSPIIAAEAGATDVRIVLARGVFVEGTVVDAAGLAVPSGEVQAVLRWPGSDDPRGFDVAPVGADGRFRLGPVAAGPIELFHQAPPTRETRWASSGLIRVVAPASGVRVIVDVRARLHGRLTGASVRGRAWWNPAEGNPPTSVALDANGGFALDGRVGAPGLLYVCETDGDRYALREGVRPDAEPLELGWADGAELSGRVVGLPPGVAAGVEAVWDALVVGVAAAPDGTFRVRALPPGRYRLRLTGSFRASIDDVPAGATDLVLTAVAR